MIRFWRRALAGKSPLQEMLAKHFDGAPLSQIVTAAREFPVTARVDLQAALDELMAAHGEAKLFGVHSAMMSYETLTLAHLFTAGPYPMQIGPLQQEEVDVGDETPARCMNNGVWLSRQDGLPFAILVAQASRLVQRAGVHVEIGVPSGERGARFSQGLFRDLEVRVGAGRTYRGRVISLEQHENYSGRIGTVKVHRLQGVSREDVILPRKTLALLDRNVAGFVAAREKIKALRFPAKKGLLFHGPPGAGKTHTIHYLASQLPEHTTLLITAEQVGLLGEYFRLARFLQPSLLVIEDVDLIARERSNLGGACEEVLLNKLLNEMDGLREDAGVVCILTTNRPDQLEPALASRPGRIDQAIEFPLPDAEGRARLVGLYSRGLEVALELRDLIVRRTEGASPAFIKELMRRSAQLQIEMGEGGPLRQAALDGAMEEMVFTGGALNLKLLGGPKVN